MMTAAKPYTTPTKILIAVANHYGVTVERMQSNAKIRSVSRSRALASYLIRTELGLSFPEIGDILHKDHSSIIQSLRRVKLQMQNEPEFHAVVDTICRQLRELPSRSSGQLSLSCPGCQTLRVELTQLRSEFAALKKHLQAI